MSEEDTLGTETTAEDGDTTVVRPCFPVFDRFSRSGLPEIGGRAFRKPRASIPSPSLFWCYEFSFAPAAAYVPSAAKASGLPDIEAAPFDADLLCAHYGQEFWQSMRLWTSGWDFYCPTVAIARMPTSSNLNMMRASRMTELQQILKSKGKRGIAKDTEAAMLLELGALPDRDGAPDLETIPKIGAAGSLRSMHVYFDFCGVYCRDEATKGPLGTGRARLGLLPTPDLNKSDVISKYGTWKEFEVLRSRFVGVATARKVPD